MELEQELEKLKKDLNKSIHSLRITAGEFAKAQCDYRIALAKKELLLRSDKLPASLVYDLARGDEEVAKLKQIEINKEAVYKANQEAINSIKLQIRLLDNQISREYGNAGNEF